MFGAMLFARAGVRVSFPPGIVDKRIAEESTLYFTFRRLRRKTNDLSMGWGSNSQWRTRFHRSYEGPEHLYFNVEGHIDHSSDLAFNRYMDDWHDWLHQAFGDRAREYPGGYDGPNGGLTYAERRELILNRSFVRTTPPGPYDWSPYDDTLTSAKEAALWLP